MTQVQQIKNHLLSGKSITQVQAMAVYGIARLSSCIEDLRNLGHDIDCVLKRDEMGKQYGEYRIRATIKQGDVVQVKRGHGYGLPGWVRMMKASKVVGKNADASLVHFIRGLNSECLWLNDKELTNAS